MQKKIRYSLFLLAAVSVAGFSVGALAEKGHGKDHGKSRHAEERYEDHRSSGHKSKGRIAIAIDDSNRLIIRDYLRESYRISCPPGLAKKHNGCLPPGQAKKLYRVGYPLDVQWQPVPDVLIERLYPAPIGYRYVMVDRDVLLIGEASKKVIDAITLLSAVQ